MRLRWKLISALIAAAALAGFGWQQFGPAPDHNSKVPHKGIVISHKTAGLEYPENSIEGFVHSLALDVDAIEIDVHVIKDGRVVLHHDPVLSDFNCFPKGDQTRLIVAQQSLADLAALDCRNYKVGDEQQRKAGTPYRIAPLEEFLELYSQSDMSKRILLEVKVWDELILHNPLHVGLDIEAMHYPDEVVADAVLAALRRFPQVQNVQFNTFSRSLLLELRRQMRADESYDFGLLYKGDYSPGEMTLLALALRRECFDFCWAPDYAEVRGWLDENDIRTFIPNFPQATSALYRGEFERHIMRDKADLKVIPWTPNYPKDWAEYEKWDFDGILTDRPSAFLEWENKQ